jgi:hypothetical protein
VRGREAERVVGVLGQEPVRAQLGHGALGLAELERGGAHERGQVGAALGRAGQALEQVPGRQRGQGLVEQLLERGGEHGDPPLPGGGPRL